MCYSKNILVAGDDSGTLWMYDIANRKTSSPKHLIPFPETNSDIDDKNVKLNDLAFSSDGNFVVVATDVNLVGFYQPAKKA